MRPAVAADGGPPERYEGDRSILYAAVVEFIHTATARSRRHHRRLGPAARPLAVHSRWGNDITVLLGDYLYIKSMALALTTTRWTSSGCCAT